MTYYNSSFMSRFDELLSESERLWEEFKNNDNGMIMDIVAFTKWSTSCLNLLDKLSVSTNRFVTQFEIWVSGGPERKMNIGAALGVLKSARHEYSCGMAIEYHLSVSATIFGGLLDEASYLLRKKYNRAAAVLLGAALEEDLKTRARSVPTITIRDKDTLHPVIHKIKSSDAGLINEFEAKQLEAVAKMRNDAAHGGDFNYTRKEVEQAYKQVESTLQSLLSSS